MKVLIFVFIFSTSIFAQFSYEDYKLEAEKLDSSVIQSYHDYFKHDSLTKVWNKRSEISKPLAYIIEQHAIHDSIEIEKVRITLLEKYKIKEVMAFFNLKEEIHDN